MHDIHIAGSPRTLIVLTGVTPAGLDWLRENCAAESYHWGGPSLTIEPAYACGIVAAAEDGGLSVDKL